MTTEKRLMPFTAIGYKEKYRVELRGLWEMKNDMMGGPFVMHAIVDGENKNVVVAEAFVYNPSGNNLMLHAESALYTLRLEERTSGHISCQVRRRAKSDVFLLNSFDMVG